MVVEHRAYTLVREAQAGNADAFEELVRCYSGRLERQITARMAPAVRLRLDPGDVLQDTLTKAFESIGLFRWQGEDSFYHWLAGIAEHLIWNAAKKRPIEPLRLDPRDPRHLSPDRRLRRTERFDRLRAALIDLSEDQREAIRLARLEGLSLKETARRMRRTPGAVQKLIARGLLSLRRSVGDTESLNLGDAHLHEQEGSGDE